MEGDHAGPAGEAGEVSMRMRVRILAGVCALILTAGPGVAALAREVTIELLGAGWPRRTITYVVDAGPRVARQAVEDVIDAVTDWNIALALEDPPLRETIGLVPAYSRRADIVVNLELAPGRLTSRLSFHRYTPFSCELTGARVELRGALLGQPERRAATRNLARHVLGHVLGLGHSDDPDSIMYRTRDTVDGVEQSDVTIGRCEVLRLWMLHPPVECPLPSITLCF
jgi:hypothetical protein